MKSKKNHRASLRRSSLAVGLALAAAGAACQGKLDQGGATTSSDLKSTIDMTSHTESAAAPESSLPAIDLRPAGHLATATFALG